MSPPRVSPDVERRIRRLAARGLDAVAIAVAIPCEWRQVVAVLNSGSAARPERPAQADVERALAALRAIGERFVRFGDGTFGLGDREFTAAELVERAKRKAVLRDAAA